MYLKSYELPRGQLGGAGEREEKRERKEGGRKGKKERLSEE